MFAVIKTGGKQYKVAKDDVIVVEKLTGEAGEVVAFESVLMVGEGAEAKSGAPFVEGVCVAGEVVEQTRGDKVLVFKKKRRQNYRRTKGHRQDLTVVRITDILTDGKKPAKKAAAPKKAEESEAKAEPKKAPASKTGAKKAAAKKTTAKKPAAKKAPASKTGAKKTAAKKTAAKKTATKKATAKKKSAAKKKDD